MKRFIGFAAMVWCLVGCSHNVKGDAIDEANIAASKAMAAGYSNKIEVCSFEAVDGQAIEIKAKKFSCNVAAAPLPFLQKQVVKSQGEKLADTVLGLAQIAAPIVGQAINTRATFRGLTDLTSVITSGVGHNIITNTSGSYNTDRHDAITTTTTKSGTDIAVQGNLGTFEQGSRNGDARDNQTTTADSHNSDSHAVDSHAVDNHTINPAPVVVQPVTIVPPVFSAVPVAVP